jgi:mono/diheme cytochrome c family protein
MRIFFAASCLIVISAPASGQSYPGDPEAGRIIALKTCSSCHVVAARQAQPATDAVPTFAAIAHDPAITETSLRVFLQTPHARMPDFILSRTETDDVISYILSLRSP